MAHSPDDPEHRDDREHRHEHDDREHRHEHDDREHRETVRRDDDRAVERERVRETRHELPPDAGKTSAAATFALVFGLSALLCLLTVFLSPLAVLFGLIALVLGLVGMRMTKRPLVTGKALAISGLVMGVLSLLLGIGVLAGAGLFLNNDANVEWIETQLERFRDELPTEVPSAP